MSVNNEPPARSLNLSSLTVPELKVLCKDRKIKGYSKLGRTALLQVLFGVGQFPLAAGVSSSSHGTIPAGPSGSGKIPDLAQVKRKKPKVKNATNTTRVADVSASVCTIAPVQLPIHDVPSGSALPAQENATQTRTDILAAGQPDLYNSPPPTPGTSTAQVSSHISTACVSGALHERIQSPQFMPPPLTVPASRPSNAVAPTSAPKSMNPATKRAAQSSTLPAPKKFKSLQTASSVSPAKSPRSVGLSINQASALPSAIPSTTLVSGPPPRNDLSALPLLINRSIPNTVRNNLPTIAKRFKPLVLKKPLGVVHSTRLQTVSPSLSRLKVPSEAATPSQAVSQPVTLQYLDFTCSGSVPVLETISLPPSLAQRKRVQCWAIILAGLPDRDRNQCALVSRMFRYAVYLLASHILEQRYAGQRLKRMTQKYSTAMTNMWPYLRLRDTEASERRQMFGSSFLWRMVKESGVNPIADRLWGSPDHKKQIAIVIRFVLTRYWFILSIGGRPEYLSSWLKETVVDAQEIIPNDLWSITVQKLASSKADVHLPPHTYYVLEPTCEVVGHAPSSVNYSSEQAAQYAMSISIRADWSSHIQQYQAHHSGSCSAVSSDAPSSIFDRLKWDNYEEYEKGVSRLWLKRLSDNAEDEMKRVVARRYVLACIVGNSVSGSWMSTSEMAQDFAGLSAKVDMSKVKNKDVPLNLYLPAVHHVESVHFRTAKGGPLHPALAVVQTPSREYFVLKDNGMEVGSEENGVYEAWMEVLKCDNQGLQML